MPNDSKYGRLYPERAVAPLRELAEEELALCQEGGNHDEATAWAGCLASLDDLGFPPDEPLFLLRGQDTLAQAAVVTYANFVRETPGAFGEGFSCRQAVAAIEDIARSMANWEPRKLPD